MESKKGVRTWIQFACIAIIFIIGGYLLLANIFHMYTISEKDKLNVVSVSKENEKTFRELLNHLGEKNRQLEAIDYTNTFTSQELLSLKNYLKTVEDRMSNAQCWNEQQISVDDVHTYEYLQCVKNMLPDSELMQSISDSLEGRTMNEIDLGEIYKEKVMEYDSYAGYELSQLQENYHYYMAIDHDEALMKSLTFAQKYMINVLEEHIHFVDFLLEDGGAM